MKRAFAWLLLFAILAAGPYAAGRVWKEKKAAEIASRREYDNGFRPAPYPLEQRPFVLFVYGFNNGATLEKTLRSLFFQAYDRYRLIYVDDASTDGSDRLAQERIEESPQKTRVTLLRNEERLGQLQSLKRAAGLCQDQEILVVLQPEEQLAHEWALAALNRYFADPDLWLAYGAAREGPAYQSRPVRPIFAEEWAHLRSANLSFGLKAFYVALFKQIKEEDLAILACSDLAAMFPLLEMAKSHYQFIPETLSLLPRAGDCPAPDPKSERAIRVLKPYEPLSALLPEAT